MSRIILRVVAYCLILLASLWAASRWFGDTYIANLGLFSLFSVVFELSWASFTHSFSCRGRRLAYVCCVAGILAGGLVLVRQSGQASAQANPEKHVRTMDKP